MSIRHGSTPGVMQAAAGRATCPGMVAVRLCAAGVWCSKTGVCGAASETSWRRCMTLLLRQFWEPMRLLRAAEVRSCMHCCAWHKPAQAASWQTEAATAAAAAHIIF
eukprot:362632-Chlamydomonas_euryale.AAC.3